MTSPDDDVSTPGDLDDRFMRRALQLAAQARGLTSPNPMVGAVLVRDGRVIGEGIHWRAGAPHAEIEALAAAGNQARGATLYVTLEPCTHYGRTAPCVPCVLGAGIRRVVTATADPNPVVAGRGVSSLRAAGVEVRVGVREDDATRLNRAYFTAMRQRRPHVTLKAAATLDGKIADIHRASRWITGEAARTEAHRLRSETDAIVVGIGTVLDDDPELTVRLGRPWPREPFRVVLDSRARTPPSARLIRAGTPSCALIMVGDAAPRERCDALAAAGATVIACPTRADRVHLAAVLAQLFDREVRALLVEGGAEVHGAFVEAGLVDAVALFVAPLLVGGRDAPGVTGGGGRELKHALRLGDMSVRQVGTDLLVEAEVGPAE